jgi:hypothetical protein
MVFRTKKRLVKGLVIVAAMAMAVGAYAYWTADGTGTGTANTANPGAQSVTVTQTSSSSGLYPGGGVPLSGTLDNANTNSVRVKTVSGTVASVDATHAAAGCLATDYSVSAAVTVDKDVPANTSTTTWSGLTLSMADTSADQGACKGATVNIGYTAS